MIHRDLERILRRSRSIRYSYVFYPLFLIRTTSELPIILFPFYSIRLIFLLSMFNLCKICEISHSTSELFKTKKNCPHMFNDTKAATDRDNAPRTVAVANACQNHLIHFRNKYVSQKSWSDQASRLIHSCLQSLSLRVHLRGCTSQVCRTWGDSANKITEWRLQLSLPSTRVLFQSALSFECTCCQIDPRGGTPTLGQIDHETLTLQVSTNHSGHWFHGVSVNNYLIGFDCNYIELCDDYFRFEQKLYDQQQSVDSRVWGKIEWTLYSS